MIMTVEELRQFVTTDETDQVLQAKLAALELLIRAYTNNNFQMRSFRCVAVAMTEGDSLMVKAPHHFKVGDTLEISDSDLNAGLVTVSGVSDDTINVNETLYDESGVVLTKVFYPADVRMGIVNMMKWELDNREKVGISSETISRHSVTYFDMNGDNSIIGYPKSLVGFMKPHMKARFGRGVR